MTVTAVVCSHANQQGLERIIDVLEGQTYPPHEILAYCSGYHRDDLERLADLYRNVRFHWAEDLDDWGHDKRATGLEQASQEWVGFFNDDDWYESHYLEAMLAAASEHGADVVYCAWNEQPGCDFHHSHSTAGNFICRTELGQEAGWPRDRVYENDGNFIERLNALTDRVVKVDELLYHHNTGF